MKPQKGPIKAAVVVLVGVSQNMGYRLGGPSNKDYIIFGSILGFPYFGKLPSLPFRENYSNCDSILALDRVPHKQPWNTPSNLVQKEQLSLWGSLGAQSAVYPKVKLSWKP